MDFNRNTTKLLSTASHGRIRIGDFERSFPRIANQIRVDANSGCLKGWGQSLNVDEYERQLIVDPKILSTIGRLAKTKIRVGNTYHAGLMHTYGYLFSRLKTRFGFKRDRWTSGVIEDGFSLPQRTFSPDPTQGTLLQNVTAFLSAIAFPGQTPFWDPSELAPAICDYPFERLSVKRIRETIRLGKTVTAEIMFDVVRLKRSRSPLDMLIYSYRLVDRRGKIAEQKLVTCFPVGSEFRKSLLGEQMGGEVLIRPRFNLALQGFSQQLGTREIVDHEFR